MPTSGIEVSDECLEKYEKMKLRKKERCIIFTLNELKTQFKIHEDVEKSTDQKQQFESIVQNNIRPILEGGKGNPGQCCFVVWDLKMLAKGASKGGQESEFLVFMGVCLDDMPVKERMLYSSSVKALKEKLTGIPKVLEVKSLSDLEYDTVMEDLK